MARTGGIHGPGQGQSTIDLFGCVRHLRRPSTVRTQHVVERAYANTDGAVVGVAAKTPSGAINVRARKAVIFTSGGFFHNEAMLLRLLRGTVWGATAPYTNTGVLMEVAEELGAMTENTDSLWWGQMGIEEVQDSHRSDNMAFGSTATAWCW